MLLRVLVSVVVGLRLNTKKQKRLHRTSQYAKHVIEAGERCLMSANRRWSAHKTKYGHFLFSKQPAKTLG